MTIHGFVFDTVSHVTKNFSETNFVLSTQTILRPVEKPAAYPGDGQAAQATVLTLIGSDPFDEKASQCLLDFMGFKAINT